MRTLTRLAALATVLAGTMIAGAGMAETLNLVCRVHETRGDGAHRNIQRRLDFDLAAKTVSIFDNTGQGWRPKRQFAFLSADAGRIRLEDGGGKQSYVDRRSGVYFFHNQKGDLTIKGPCQ